MNHKIHKAAVIGAGVMGCNIAGVLAGAGVQVLFLDVVPKELSEEDKVKGLTKASPTFRNKLALAGLARMTHPKSTMLYSSEHAAYISTGNMEDDMNLLADCDWIIEVVVERLDVKRAVMKTVSEYRKPGAIVSTNTSGVSIRQIASELPEEFRQHFIGTHFFNPVRYMKLFELIPTEDTLPELVEFMADFAERELGKGVVYAKDTANFIGNRIGAFASIDVMRQAKLYDFNIPTADFLTGPVIGRPKSATFRTADLVGLDIVGNVSRNVIENVADPYEHEAYAIPEYVSGLIQSGALGDKAKRGFYKKEVVNGKSVTLAFDWNTGDYALLEAEKSDCVKAALRSPNKYQSMVSGEEKEQQFIWTLLSNLLIYSARLVPEITEDYAMIDKAMRWGYNWEKGPFEIWDALGVEETAKRMRDDGHSIPSWVDERLAAGNTTFYGEEMQKSAYLCLSDSTIPEIRGNKDASLKDLGDRVICLEMHTKGNAIGEGVMEMMEAAAEELNSGRWIGLVLGNQGNNFSAGADLDLILSDAKKGQADALKKKIARLQNAMLGLKYAPGIVVAAPFGTVLGGGAEMVMHADGVVAHVETYMGQVEAGVGLLPGSGGCKELLLRAMERCTDESKMACLPALKQIWKIIATGSVTSNAFDAVKKGFLRPDTKILLNRDGLLDAAKQRVLEIAAWGYHPPVAPAIRVLGEFGFASIQYDILAMKHGGFISEHDALVATRTAYVLTGGNVAAGTVLTEADILALELEAFADLAGEIKTQERIEAMLTTGKPVRN